MSFFTAPRMKATYLLCVGMSLLSMAVLPLLSREVAHLFVAVGTLVVAYGRHRLLWLFEVTDTYGETFTVKGLSETVRDLGDRYGCPVAGAKAVKSQPDFRTPDPCLVDRTELQISQDLLTEPWPQIRYLLAVVIATTAVHRRSLWISLVVGAALPTVIFGSLYAPADKARITAVGASSLGLFILAIIARIVWSTERRRIARRILLTEADVEPGLEWTLPI